MKNMYFKSNLGSKGPFHSQVQEKPLVPNEEDVFQVELGLKRSLSLPGPRNAIGSE